MLGTVLGARNKMHQWQTNSLSSWNFRSSEGDRQINMYIYGK